MHKPLAILAALCLLSSCYRQETRTSDAWIPTEAQLDSISFYTTHHYTQNYNFVVTADSLLLVVGQPSEVVAGMLVDTICVYKDDRLVVADIVTMPADTTDSVWVRLARDEQTMGWGRESRLLPCLAPDNPISQFIDFFSDTHMLIVMGTLVLVTASLVVRRLSRRNARIVHFNDIDSFYPALLAMSVALSAVLYGTIQLTAPDSWRHYYYHPTLNPFSVPLHLGLFLVSVWTVLIVALAAIDDIRRRLSPTDSFFYCLGLVGVCAAAYVVFSIATLYYVGYPLFVVYVVAATWSYFKRNRARYVCGNCGQPMHAKGTCHHCGAIND